MRAWRNDRVEWLLGQLRGIDCVAAGLAGEELAWSDRVERCFGIRPRHVDEEVFRAGHERLNEVLPGTGDLSSRYNAWLDAVIVPNETLPPVLEALSADLRRRTGELVELPAGEGSTTRRSRASRGRPSTTTAGTSRASCR